MCVYVCIFVCLSLFIFNSSTIQLSSNDISNHSSGTQKKVQNVFVFYQTAGSSCDTDGTWRNHGCDTVSEAWYHWELCHIRHWLVFD